MSEIGGKILVVDDVLRNVQVLGSFLRQEGYDLVIARNGEQGLEVARKTRPDLVLLDVMMPGMSGFAVCEALKADPALADIPVIFLTAKVETADIVRGFRAGGVDYVTKPFQSVELLQRVRTHLELRAKRRALEQSYADLREAEHLRDTLVHMVVHDLRAPLAGIFGYLELLSSRAAEFSERNRTYLDRATVQTNLLIAMISNVLDVSRLEEGKLVLNRQPAPLRRLALEARETLGTLAEVIEVGEFPPAAVAADPDLVRRVFLNLFSNAIKYSPSQSPVEVWGEVVRTENGGASGLRVCVRDHGQGIAPKALPHVFEKFVQEEGRVRAPLSSGLGLTFCRLAVEAHGGTLNVESKVGEGSLFSFVLPLSEV
jgi:signal transduction histidine kinase